MKIVFLDAATLGETPLDEIAALGELVAYPMSTREEALARVGDCEVLIVNKVRVDAELLSRAPRLRLICEAATGVNNIDLEAAAARGIPVRNAAGYSTEAVVQSTFAHLLSLAGYAPYFDDCVKSGRYSAGPLFCDISHPYMELAGKTLGIIGLGAIGTRVAAVASAFGMRVIYYSTSGTSHNSDYPSVPLDELLAQADAVSIHAPLNERTKGLLGAAELRRMKPTAFLLNLGRGGIVEEAALAEAVDAGVIAGAALDVYVAEPLPADSPLLHVRHPERFRFSPHTAWASREALLRLVHQVAENIRGTVLEITGTEERMSVKQ
ncbi:MAG: hydroxyacid dehydrogenase [Bacteroidales bacterium]|nr:hydroxyacid dehydrogenase [Bacteroidales bacterium]